MFKKSNSQGFSIGVDIEEVVRFRKLSRTNHRRFLERIFTARELKYCFSKKDPAPHLAARFCAKEAVVKALASIGIHRVAHRDVEIMNAAKGVPLVVCHPKHKNVQIQVSISHARRCAIASAVTLSQRLQDKK